jgi:uncharacterized membrane protein HdeD (DUF308 family)
MGLKPFRPRLTSLEVSMVVPLVPVISIIAGILILVFPRLLNYVVALYLIIVGVAELVRYF